MQPIAWRLILGLAGVKLAAHLATDWQYGFQRDELYYLDCARHLAWGFVDFPPVTPLIAFLDQLVFSGSLEGLRLAPALAGTAIVVLAGLIARELGGDRLAQGLAALATAVSSIFLGANLLFQTVTIDELSWAAVVYLLARAPPPASCWPGSGGSCSRPGPGWPSPSRPSCSRPTCGGRRSTAGRAWSTRATTRPTSPKIPAIHTSWSSCCCSGPSCCLSPRSPSGSCGATRASEL